MDRRGFLGSILALGAAPAIVRADSLMRIVPTDTLVIDLIESQYTFTRESFAYTVTASLWVRTPSGGWDRQSKVIPAGQPVVMKIEKDARPWGCQIESA